MTQYAPQPTQQAPTKPGNGLGVTGFVLGVIGLVLSFIPLIGVVAWPLVILGIIFSSVGISKAVRKNASGKGLSIAGVVVSIIGLVVCILWTVVWKKAADEVNDEANREAVIVYEITGDAQNVDVTYSVFSDENMSTKDETVATLPWKKEVKTKGLVKEGQVIVTTGESGGSVTCTITVDGKKVESNTASGAFEMATCDSI